MNTVCIAFANGCPRSRVEIARLFSYFELNGWKIKQTFSSADLVVVATCGVSQRAETKSVRLLSRARSRMKPNARLFVVGCLGGINTAVLKPFKVEIFKPVDMDQIDSAINARVKLSQVQDVNSVSHDFLKAQGAFTLFDRLYSEFALSQAFLQRLIQFVIPHENRRLVQEPQQQDVFSIKIAKGCMEQCSYCAIRFAEGQLRSKPAATILKEFETGLNAGYRIFTLVAGDTGSYGQDIGTDITELLESIFRTNRQFKLHIKDFGPRWFAKYESPLIDIFAANSGRIGNVMFPVQSGSDRILSLMQRNYTSGQLRQAFSNLRLKAGHIRISTHVIVGFPGETEDDFNKTLDLLRDVEFDRIDIYPYSDRPGTEACLMRGKVSESQITNRINKLRKAFKRTSEFAC